MKPKVVITNRVHPEVISYLWEHCTVIANTDRDRPFTRAQIIEQGSDTAAILAFMPDCIDAPLLAALPDLRIVSCALKGYDNFDVEACTRCGVWLSIVSDLLTEPTAELTIGLMIALARNILPGDRFMRSGRFAGWRPRFYGTGLANRTVAIIGMGAIGRAVAERLAGFRTKVLYVDRQPLRPETETALRVRRTSLEEALRRSDFVVVALPLSQLTYRLFDTGTISRMKPGSYLINPGRGSVVDEDAVADALATGHLAGYAADVFEMEDWAQPDRCRTICTRLLDDVERTCLTPHLGSAVGDVRLKIEMQAARNIIEALRGERPHGAINEVRATYHPATV